jgi:hypothetical protein
MKKNEKNVTYSKKDLNVSRINFFLYFLLFLFLLFLEVTGNLHEAFAKFICISLPVMIMLNYLLILSLEKKVNERA